MATTKGHKFQVNAVQVLAALPSSVAVNEMIRPLLNSEETLVRIAAYRMLAANKDGSIFSTALPSGFVMDIVKSEGPPIIYATRRGQPRLAIIGNRTSLEMPIVFAAIGDPPRGDDFLPSTDACGRTEERAAGGIGRPHPRHQQARHRRDHRPIGRGRVRRRARGAELRL
jgi:hypothetical protein